MHFFSVFMSYKNKKHLAHNLNFSFLFIDTLSVSYIDLPLEIMSFTSNQAPLQQCCLWNTFLSVDTRMFLI